MLSLAALWFVIFASLAARPSCAIKKNDAFLRIARKGTQWTNTCILARQSLYRRVVKSFSSAFHTSTESWRNILYLDNLSRNIHLWRLWWRKLVSSDEPTNAPVNRQVYAITIFITTVYSLNALVLSTVDRRLRLVTSESFRFRYFLGQPGPVAIR